MQQGKWIDSWEVRNENGVTVARCDTRADADRTWNRMMEGLTLDEVINGATFTVHAYTTFVSDPVEPTPLPANVCPVTGECLSGMAAPSYTPAHLKGLPYVSADCRVIIDDCRHIGHVTGWETPGDNLPVFDYLTVKGASFSVERAHLTFKGWELDLSDGRTLTVHII